MNNIGNVEELYNANHTQWSRNEKTSLSDFTARPKVFELLGNLKGKTIASAFVKIFTTSYFSIKPVILTLLFHSFDLDNLRIEL